MLWEFQVSAGCEAEFVEAYGPAGWWAELFQRAQGYLGTQLLRDTADPHRYLTIDRWTSAAAFEAFKRQWGSEYEALDQRCARLTERETLLGTIC
ncbi:MAG: antibiotic biosynthesis monooxygenase [Chloroflexi bacterium]|nr:antibiotic biosynthesis monooxygenase [Chloroflexota bacterium]MCI0575576.1 antibiotic biosynthesis monooxygenase [Chloroflexota bacterium]MCI0648265.1 antibiotic biosynthesis monooxygenase [Chloroflexota bacterium]